MAESIYTGVHQPQRLFWADAESVFFGPPYELATPELMQSFLFDLTFSLNRSPLLVPTWG